jgi:hypothetical protein
MPSSGTQTFPTQTSLGDIGLYALNRVGVHRPTVTQDHLTDVAMAANMVLSDLSTEQPNLWKLVQNSISLVQGTTTYTLPANVLLVTDCIIRTLVGGIQNDRVIYGVSKTDYLSYPNKLLQEPPTVYWQDRVVPIQMSLYPTPDGNGPYTLIYLAIQQDDDAVLGTAATLDLPYRFVNAFKDLLVAELALTYAPDRAQLYGAVAAASKQRAQMQDREMTPVYITPGLQRYYRY